MDNDSEMRFEPGSVVMLKSGGPGLTVLGQAGDRVHCVFFSDEIGEFRETSLPLIALQEAEAEEEDEEEDAESTSEEEGEPAMDEVEDDGDQPGDGKTAAAA